MKDHNPIPDPSSAVLLCDLGGTHARLGYLKDGKIDCLAKYTIADIQDHAALFRQYKEEYNLDTYYIAIAASACHTSDSFPSGFIDNSKITPASLKKSNYTLLAQLNDFEASAWGAAFYTKPVEVWHKGKSNLSNLECLIGPGTGLGCAFMDTQREPPYILAAWPGGNMRPSFATSEQAEILSILQKTSKTAITYEDLASGRGMEKLYNLFCPDMPFPGVAAIVDNLEHPIHTQILRIFHEFLGLYIQNTAVTVAAGKVILHGGLLDYLIEKDAFNFAQLHSMVTQPYVESLAHYLCDLPIYYIQDTYLALDGLKNYLEHTDI